MHSENKSFKSCMDLEICLSGHGYVNEGIKCYSSVTLKINFVNVRLHWYFIYYYFHHLYW